MKYKLLALDLDDTLLDEHSKISSRNIKAIRKVAEKGTLVTIATGVCIVPPCLLPGIEIESALITYHGALIRKADDKEILRHSKVPFEPALEILELGEEKGFHLNLYFDDKLFTKEENESTRYYRTIASVPVKTVGNLAKFLLREKIEPTKLTIINQEGRLGEIQQMVRERFSKELIILQSRPHFLEITHKEATKGQALDYLAKRKGISADEILAFGDSYNDIDMLQYAGMGVAMANAPEDIKKAADFVTGTNTENGLPPFWKNICWMYRRLYHMNVVFLLLPVWGGK